MACLVSGDLGSRVFSLIIDHANDRYIFFYFFFHLEYHFWGQIEAASNVLGVHSVPVHAFSSECVGFC